MAEIYDDSKSNESSCEEEEIQKKTAKKNKSGKDRAPYVLTDKRKEQFEKARQARADNIKTRNAGRDEKQLLLDTLKAELEKKKVYKQEKKKKNEIKILMHEAETSSEEEQIVVKKVKKPAKKKKVVYVQESSSEEEEIIEKKKKPTKKKPIKKPESEEDDEPAQEYYPPQQTPSRQLRPLVRYC